MESASIVGVRLSKVERRKLEELAKKTERNLSEVLRLLLAQARAEDLPDIRLSAEEKYDSRLQEIMERHGAGRRFTKET